MSVEENKKTHEKFINEVWMARNPDVVDEVISDRFSSDWGKGAMTIEHMKAMCANHDKNARRVVRTEYHERVGEGDLLAVWKTQHFSDGSSEEGLTLWKFENGKIVTYKWFTPPKKAD